MRMRKEKNPHFREDRLLCMAHRGGKCADLRLQPVGKKETKMNLVKKTAAAAIISFAVAVLAISRTGTSAAPQTQPFQIVQIWFHVHENLPGDDGSESVKSIADYLKARGYRGVVITPHSAGLSFPDFKAAADEQNTSDFIVVPGREIATIAGTPDEEQAMCHLNAISGLENPPVLDLKYKIEQLPDLIAALDGENAVYDWNHPWTCPQWEQSAGLFKGIEIFNEFGPGYINGKSYDFDKRMYLSDLKKGLKVFVVGGIDMHVIAQATLGDFATYVFPDEFNRDSLVSAIRNGNTIAAFNAKIYSLNARPSLKSVAAAGNTFEIEGRVGLNSYNGYKPSLIVYKDGVEYSPSSPATFVRGKKNAKQYVSYEFSFGDNLAPGTSACYVFEITHFIISSPYCFTAGNN
jgi:hypothetical protein